MSKAELHTRTCRCEQEENEETKKSSRGFLGVSGCADVIKSLLSFGRVIRAAALAARKAHAKRKRSLRRRKIISSSAATSPGSTNSQQRYNPSSSRQDGSLSRFEGGHSRTFGSGLYCDSVGGTGKADDVLNSMPFLATSRRRVLSRCPPT